MSTAIFKKTAPVLLVAIAFILIACPFTMAQQGKLKVDGGWIQGKVDSGLTVFKGIPFAAPPVGHLRCAGVAGVF